VHEGAHHILGDDAREPQRPVPVAAAPSGAAPASTSGAAPPAPRLILFWALGRDLWRRALLPGGLVLLILVALVPGIDALLGVDVAIAAMLLGGVAIAYPTLVTILEKRRITAGVLVVIAIIGSAYVGEYLAAAVVAFMMLAGEFLEEITLQRTRNAVRELVRLTPDVATVERDGAWTQVALRAVRAGDRVLVRPGDRVPVDGTILSGEASLSEASITGESMPVDKTVGAKVFAGTTSQSGALVLRADRVGRETTIGRIIQIVRAAQEQKGAVQKIADRFAGHFTPIILSIAVLVWILTRDLYRVMAVLVIACPCALVLATPTAVVASVGNAARRGGLIKGGVSLETAGQVTAVAFDKTGTLTLGRPEVVAVEPLGGRTGRDVLEMAGIAEVRSEHPLGRAIVDHARAQGLAPADPEDFVMTFGRGVAATWNGRRIEVGNPRILPDRDPALDVLASHERRGRTALVVRVDGEPWGVIALADAVRPQARAAVERLRALGVERIIMLTGDHAVTASAIAQEVGITDVRAGLLPEQKLDVIRELRAVGEVVAMVGDGVNDAPALALADVGVAMGAAGTDVALETADVALMGDDLGLLPEILALSRRALGIIRQNIWGFAVAVNIVGIVLAGSGVLSPIGAAIVHNVASLFVVINSGRLLTFRSRPVQAQARPAPALHPAG
jgi:heavy metal translocating P-type ATPase